MPKDTDKKPDLFKGFVSMSMETDDGLSGSKSGDSLDHGNKGFNLSDVYEFEEEIATGGIKIIKRVLDGRTGRFVAMATLKPEYNDPRMVEEFLLEARIMSNLEHSNIVPLYEMGYNEGGLPYFTMKLLDGETLHELLKKMKSDPEVRKAYPLSRLLEIYAKVCDAVAFAHSRGIIHLDLKPENVLLNKYGEVLVLDWGCAFQKENSGKLDRYVEKTLNYASVLGNIQTPDRMQGTPAYLSPEQVNQEEDSNSEYADIYALGIILYEILFVDRPYGDMSVEELLAAKKEGLLPRFPDAVDQEGVPASLVSVCKKAMVFDKEDRYSTIDSIQEDIQLYKDGFSTKAEDATFLTDLYLFSKRQKKAIASLVVSISVIIMIAVLSNHYIEEANISKDAFAKVAEKANEMTEAAHREINNGIGIRERVLRSNHDYKGALAAYDNILSTGYSNDLILLRKAFLLLGGFQFEEALLTQSRMSPGFRYKGEVLRLVAALEALKEISLQRPLHYDDYIIHTEKLVTRVRSHVFWTINSNIEKTLDDKLKVIRQALLMSNKNILEDNFHFEYQIEKGEIDLDLSDNVYLRIIAPLTGLPIRKLNLENNVSISNAQIQSVKSKHLKELNVSNIDIVIGLGKNIERLIAKNIIFASSLPEQISYIDAEGASFKAENFIVDGKGYKLEYLNIAHSNFTEFSDLLQCKKLKTLVIDRGMPMTIKVERVLKNRGVEILVK